MDEDSLRRLRVGTDHPRDRKGGHSSHRRGWSKAEDSMASGLGAHLKGSPLALSTGTQDATWLCPHGHTDSGGNQRGNIFG